MKRLRAPRLFLCQFLLLSYTLVGCAPDEAATKAAPGRAWTNPITGDEVQMPEGWRSSPAHARKGQKSIGFFKPKPQLVLASAYTHVSLHYEEIAGADGMPLDEFAGNFAAVIKSWDGEVGTVEKGSGGGWRWARLQARVPLKGRQPQRLQTRIWTADQKRYWYAVVESPWEDSLTAVRAEPLIQRLKDSFATKTSGTKDEQAQKANSPKVESGP